MGFNKRIYSREGIQNVAKLNDIQTFIDYFKSDGFSFADKFSNNVYLQLIEIYRIKNQTEKEKALTDLINFCQKTF